MNIESIRDIQTCLDKHTTEFDVIKTFQSELRDEHWIVEVQPKNVIDFEAQARVYRFFLDELFPAVQQKFSGQWTAEIAIKGTRRQLFENFYDPVSGTYPPHPWLDD